MSAYRGYGNDIPARRQCSDVCLLWVYDNDLPASALMSAYRGYGNDLPASAVMSANRGYGNDLPASAVMSAYRGYMIMIYPPVQ